MIISERKENRGFEKTLIKIWAFINPLLTGKSLSKYRGLTGQDIATAMMNAAKNQKDKVKIFHWQEMMGLGSDYWVILGNAHREELVSSYRNELSNRLQRFNDYCRVLF